MPAAERSDELTEFSITHVLNAPPELVFDVWTVPEHFVEWFAPRAARIPFCELDARPGGAIHFCHQFEDGTSLWAKGVFEEVVRPTRLVFTLGFVDEDGNPGRHPMVTDWPLDALITTTVDFDETAGKTSITVRQRLRPAEAASVAGVAKERRLARQGWAEVLDRLDAHLDRLDAHLDRLGAHLDRWAGGKE